jgi:hypothetical protein
MEFTSRPFTGGADRLEMIALSSMGFTPSRDVLVYRKDFPA